MLIVQRLAFAVFGAILVYFAFASSAWNRGYTQAEFGLPSVLPDNPNVTMWHAMEAFFSNGNRLPDALQETTDAAFQYNLLQEEPLLFEATDLLSSGKDAKAKVLLEEARHRNSRSREVRIFLLDRYLSSGEVRASIDEIGALVNLLPEGREALAATAIGLLSDPKTRKEASEAMRASPMRMPILDDLARYGASPYLIMAITPDLKGAPVWADNIIDQYVTRSDIAGAFSLWAHTQPDDSTIGQVGIRDENFDGKSNPPFGWKLYTGPAGTAKINNDGLQITHSGESGAIFVRQLLTLPPGRHSLSFDTGQGADKATNLVWRIDCLGSGQTLLVRPLASLYSFEDQGADSFVVPPQGCPGQWVALAGRALETPETRSLEIKRVSIDREPTR